MYSVLISLLLVSLINCHSEQQPDGYCEHHFPEVREFTNFKLKHLTVIIRHGDRTPYGPCWNNAAPWSCPLERQERPGINPSNRIYAKQRTNNRQALGGNCSLGQLTLKGFLQQQKNGQKLGALYNSLIGVKFDSKNMYVRSTDVSRTFASIESLLLALFPTSSSNCIQETINIETMDALTENMSPGTRSSTCPKLGELSALFHKSSTYLDFQKNILIPLEADIAAVLKQNMSILSFSDCLQAYVCHQMDIPPGITQDLYDRSVNASELLYDLEVTQKDPNSLYNYAQIAMGAFMRDVFVRIQGVHQNMSSEKAAFFSGHDTTLLPILAALGNSINIWPPYASLMRIELLTDPTWNEDYVVTYYNNEIMQYPGCDKGGKLCRWSTWATMITNIINADNLCGSMQEGKWLNKRV